MVADAQGSLFGEGGMAPPRTAAATPDADGIRRRVHGLLATLRGATVAMPLSDRDLRMWRTVLPNMTKWLPDPEATGVLAEFEREVHRLTAAPTGGEAGRSRAA
jgi:hypothetical protein